MPSKAVGTPAFCTRFLGQLLSDPRCFCLIKMAKLGHIQMSFIDDLVSEPYEGSTNSQHELSDTMTLSGDSYFQLNC